LSGSSGNQPAFRPAGIFFLCCFLPHTIVSSACVFFVSSRARGCFLRFPWTSSLSARPDIVDRSGGQFFPWEGFFLVSFSSLSLFFFFPIARAFPGSPRSIPSCFPPRCRAPTGDASEEAFSFFQSLFPHLVFFPLPRPPHLSTDQTRVGPTHPRSFANALLGPIFPPFKPPLGPGSTVRGAPTHHSLFLVVVFLPCRPGWGSSSSFCWSNGCFRTCSHEKLRHRTLSV